MSHVVTWLYVLYWCVPCPKMLLLVIDVLKLVPGLLSQHHKWFGLLFDCDCIVVGVCGVSLLVDLDSLK